MPKGLKAHPWKLAGIYMPSLWSAQPGWVALPGSWFSHLWESSTKGTRSRNPLIKKGRSCSGELRSAWAANLQTLVLEWVANSVFVPIFLCIPGSSTSTFHLIRCSWLVIEWFSGTLPGLSWLWVPREELLQLASVVCQMSEHMFRNIWCHDL